VALVLALVNGLPERNLLMVLALDVLLLAAIWVADESRSGRPSRVMRLTLDRVFTDLEGVTLELRERMAVEPLSVTIDEVDFVRETTRVSVRYTVEDPWWQWSDADAAAQRADTVESGQTDAR
jgi:hypothetical protein